MSVLRGDASTDEFKRIIQMRIKKPDQAFHGIATASCNEIRALTAGTTDGQRKKGDGLYYVLDSDMPDLPYHARCICYGAPSSPHQWP
jgi:hypothetical protein